jgi:hypothetical protein
MTRSIGHNIRLNAFYRAVPCHTSFSTIAVTALRARKVSVVTMESKPSSTSIREPEEACVIIGERAAQLIRPTYGI